MSALCYNLFKNRWEDDTVLKKNKSALYIVLVVAVCSGIMCVIDGIITPPYAIKSAFKLVLFMAVPLIYFALNKPERATLKTLFTPKRKDFLVALLLGFGVFGVILAAYFIFRNVFDFSGITGQLTGDVGVTKDNFVFVAIYISLVNSLLEEFFFRGFAFLTLKNKLPRWLAYAFSSGLFAFYHVGMTAGWFSPILYILAMVGLFIGGCIFNFLNEKCQNIYPSWLVHMFANFGINTIGFILFGII